MTQVELAKAARITQLSISDYETGLGFPPAPLVARLAPALEVSSDELLAKATAAQASTFEKVNAPRARRLWKKFQQMAALPEKDQRAVMRLNNSLSTARALKPAPLELSSLPEQPSNRHRTRDRTDTGQSPDAHRTPRAFRQCAFRCAEGARDGVLAQITSPAPISFSHFFDGWKQTGAEREPGQGRASLARSSERSADP